MKKKYILYIIINNNRSLIKIGKTTSDSAVSRYALIDKHFGPCKFNESYFISSEKEQEINTLERILHKSFYDNRKGSAFHSGIGKTEWFSYKILDNVINQISYLRKNNSNYKNLSGLNKGLITFKIMEEKKRIKKHTGFFKKAFIIFNYLIYLSLFSSLFLLFVSKN